MSEGPLRIIVPSYLESVAGKKSDLLRRLRKLLDVVEKDESIDPTNAPEWAPLSRTATLLSQRFIHHKDKEVRLLALRCVLEILALCAPECPLDETEIKAVFRQTITQIASLGNATDPSKDNFTHYQRILELLANVRIGVVLVELCKNEQGDQKDEADDASLELLAEFVHSLLHCLRNEHPDDTRRLAQKAIEACIDEYEPNTMPIQILDELLLCLGAGPHLLVTDMDAVSNLQKKKQTKQNTSQQTLPQKQVPNPSYVAAAKVLQSALNRLATPVATLINGLLTKDPHTVEHSNISTLPTDEADVSVYTIVYELHRIAPTVLTTILGTLSHGLETTQHDTRLAVTKLLGNLFSSCPKLAHDFRPIWKDWLKRANDVQESVRRSLVHSLVALLAKAHHDMTLLDANQTLTHVLTHDPETQVRLDVIFKVCDWAYRRAPGPSTSTQALSPRLLQAIGSRVSSKNKDERKNAMTGLSQLFYRQYMAEKVKRLCSEDDGSETVHVLETLHEMCPLSVYSRRHQKRKRRSDENGNEDDDYKELDQELYGWIPAKVMECAFFTDQVDSDMRSRVVQILDEVLLGSQISSNASKHLTATARAVGLTCIVHSVTTPQTSTAYKYLRQLFEQRATLQKVLKKYLEARVEMKELEQGSEAFFTAEAKTMDLLNKVASFTAPAPGNDPSKALEAFHGARDKHIFRLLSTIAEPKQTAKTRSRVMDELPKRCKSLGEVTCKWVKELVRRCSMGDFINAEVAAECIRLAHDSFGEEDIPACAALLTSVKTIVDIFPALGGLPESFALLTDLFSSCRTVTDKDMKKELAETGILTTISSILSAVAPRRQANDDMELEADVTVFQEELLQLCTRDGTPEQARNAVYTLARMMASGETRPDPALSQEKKEAFSQVLQALTSPSKLALSTNETSPKMVRILSSLAALADCAPDVLLSGERGQRALKFALETVLMGRNRSEEADSDDDSGDEQEARTPHSSRKQRVSGSSRKHITPESSASLLEDENLSIPCRTLCAAIDFLVCSIRSAVLHSKQSKSNTFLKPVAPYISKVVKHLTQILRDQGVPPSNSDRRSCKARQDRAALRQSAAIHLIRLCDGRLGLEKYLDSSGWHCLAETLLDEERVVREACMEELSNIMTGTGVYSSAGIRRALPSLRLVALTTLCTDGGSGAACGNAAKVGKAVSNIKASAFTCIVNLRKACDLVYNQCKANGRESEFEKFKTELMPEYMVPYAIHLLTHRRETPFAAFAGGLLEVDDDVGVPVAGEQEGQEKVLLKRLKMLFEPLIQSLGENADNISFLLRMTEMLGKSFRPVDAAPGFSKPNGGSIGSDSSSVVTAPAPANSKREQLLEAKLKAVSAVAREVLLTYVKKDSNLAAYPGKIMVPSFLFIQNGRRGSKFRSDNRQPVGSVPTSTQDTSSSGGSRALRPLDDFDSQLPDKRKRSRSPVALKSSTKPSPESQSSVGSGHSTQKRKRSRSPLGRESSKQPARESQSSIDSDHPQSAKKGGRVHFSPDVQFRPGSSAHQSVLSGENGSEHFGDVSPIVQSESPASSHGSMRKSPRLSSSAPTLGTTPPSILHGATMYSTAPGTSNSDPSPKRSPVVQSEIRGSRGPPKISSDSGASAADEDDAVMQSVDTFEPQEPNEEARDSSQQSDPFVESKRPTRQTRGKKPPTESQQEPPSPVAVATAKRQSKKGVPKHININRVEMPSLSMDSDQPVAKKTKKRAGPSAAKKNQDLDFDFGGGDAEDENEGNRQRKKGKKKVSVAEKHKAGTKTASRPIRSRR